MLTLYTFRYMFCVNVKVYPFFRFCAFYTHWSYGHFFSCPCTVHNDNMSLVLFRKMWKCVLFFFSTVFICRTIRNCITSYMTYNVLFHLIKIGWTIESPEGGSSANKKRAARIHTIWSRKKISGLHEFIEEEENIFFCVFYY